MGILRLLLALSVVASHCGPIWQFTLVDPAIAVQSFYIISGFYMSLILNEKYVGKNKSYKLFVTNRFLRLYPIYWTVLLLTIFISAVAAIVTHGNKPMWFGSYSFIRPNFLTLLYLIPANLLIFGQDIALFLGINPISGNLFFTSNFKSSVPTVSSYILVPQAWTLGLELLFYLIAPFILKRGFKVIFLFIAFSLILRFFTYDYLGLKNDPWTYRFFPTEFMFFLSGYLSYRLYLRIKVLNMNKYLNLIILFFVIAFILAYPFLPVLEVFYLPFSLKQLLFFSTIIMSIPVLFNFLKKSNLDNKIGSYRILYIFRIC